jgi:hypothetical protein
MGWPAVHRVHGAARQPSSRQISDHTTSETEVSRTIDIKAVAECPFGCPSLTRGQRVEGWIAWPSTFLGERMQLKLVPRWSR